MVKSTLIARVADGLPLAASMDDEETEDLTEYKQQAKTLFKGLSQNAEQRCSIESPPYVFHYLIEFGVCYLCLCDRSYPKKLAYQYLEELQKEFQSLYGGEIGTAARPYAFVKFDSFIQRTKKLYKDARTQRNLHKLNEDLSDVTRIMTKNIQDVLGRGKVLDDMSAISQNLSAESKKYLRDTRHLNWQALYQKYGPVLVVTGVVSLVLYLRFFWW
ncbi:SNAP receptor [Polyrhizophydium stewartii]|uniref:Protein transport protein SEC22 n=1 Tax=Polyrhizophydium stewartii TaxID=2732419 RepID=A0ABR4N7H3_9FUNG